MSTPVQIAPRCERCFLPAGACLCAEIPSVHTRTRLLVVRHVRERWKKSNTGGLATLALPNSALLPYCVPGVPFDAAALSQPGTWLLFPGGAPAPRDAPPPRQLVVLDASWAQARRMSQRMEALRGLPRLALPPPAPGTLRLRKPSHPEGMSTLEAICRAVALLEGPEVAAPLERLHALRVRRIAELGSML